MKLKTEPRANRAQVRFVSAPLMLGLLILKHVFDEAGEDVIITCVNDGIHVEGSKHYSGDAIDVRTWHINKQTAARIYAIAKVRLGPDYDLVLESGQDRHGEHLHLEHHPKGS